MFLTLEGRRLERYDALLVGARGDAADPRQAAVSIDRKFADGAIAALLHIEEAAVAGVPQVNRAWAHAARADQYRRSAGVLAECAHRRAAGVGHEERLADAIDPAQRRLRVGLRADGRQRAVVVYHIRRH